MDHDSSKWFCSCGQVNADYRQECVNCGGPSSEGSACPPSLDQVLESGRPVAPSRLMGNITTRIIRRARVYEDDQQLVVTERRSGRWIGFLLLASTSGLLVLFLTMAMPSRDLEGYGLWLFSSMTIVPTLLFGAFLTFPHIRLVLTRSGECMVERRWLLFTYSSRCFPLDEYLLASGERFHSYTMDEGPKVAMAAVSAAVSFGNVVILSSEKREVSTRLPTVAVITGPGGDQYNLATLTDGSLLDQILDGASRLVPGRVIISGQPER